MHLYDVALKVINILNNHGFVAYIVGGYVRDKLLNIYTEDIDITTNALPQELNNIFKVKNSTSQLYLSTVIMFEDYEFEITTFRSDILYKDHRHPITQVANNLSDDLIRRDFTINSLVLDVNEQIIDLYDGLSDLNNHIVKTIGDPYKRFDEDVLRILRGIYLTSKLGFDIESNTLKGMTYNAKYLTLLSIDRITEELNKIISYDNYKKALSYLQITTSSKYIGIDMAISTLLKSNLKPTIDDIYTLSLYYKDNFNYVLPKHKLSLYNNAISLIEKDLKDLKVLYYNNIEDIILASRLQSYIYNKDINIDEIIKLKNNLPIKNRKDIKIDIKDIVKIKNQEPGSWINDLLTKIENNILDNKINNNYQDIINFINKEE